MAIANKYPTIRPSLNLDFANSKTVDPRITFSRASSATYFDEKGVMRTAPAGVPRIDHDPVTGECKGLLIEEQRTNLLTYSEEFTQSAWIKTRAAVTANAAIAPDGTLTAGKLVEDTSTNNTHDVSRFITPPSGAITLFCYVKASGRTQVVLESFEGSVPSNPFSAIFDLSTGTVVSSSGLTTSSSIVAVGNGWYRVSASGTSAGTNTAFTIRLVSGGTTAYTGDGTSGLYIWGAQLEAGSFPTTYIKTGASQVTRTVDSAVMTGTNFSDWYRQDEGTFVVGFSSPVPSYPAAAHVFSVSSGSGTELGGVFISSMLSTASEYYASGTLQATLGLGVTPANTKARVATAYKADDFAASLGGATPITDTSGVPPMPNRLHLGIRYDGTRALNGHVSKLTYYPKRLTNEQLQALTA